MNTSYTNSSSLEPIKVWDLCVRVFHWSLALCVLLNFFVFEEGEDLHQYSGYVACGLVFLRAIWGFIGTTYARFSNFWPTRSKLKDEFRTIAEGEITVHIGHSPIGALVMLTMVACIAGLGLSGYLLDTDYFFGSDLMEEIHEIIGNFLMSLVGLHVAAAILLSKLEKTNLVSAMITGIKKFKP
jgi:cytochrome b